LIFGYFLSRKSNKKEELEVVPELSKRLPSIKSSYINFMSWVDVGSDKLRPFFIRGISVRRFSGSANGCDCLSNTVCLCSFFLQAAPWLMLHFCFNSILTQNSVSNSFKLKGAEHGYLD
jgi:hypothetical protein